MKWPRCLAAVVLAASCCVRPQRSRRPKAISAIAMGADRKLLDWDKVVSYFRLLEKVSDRIRVDELGKSTAEGPSSPPPLPPPTPCATSTSTARFSERLADPRRTPRAEAEQLDHEGQDGSADHLLHSSDGGGIYVDAPSSSLLSC